MFGVRVGSFRRFHHLFAVCLVALSSLASPAGAVEGKWSLVNPTTPPASPGFTQIHMALLPGDGSPYHSRIVTYQDSSATQGAVLGWSEGIAGCDNVAPYSLPVIGTWGLPAQDPQAFALERPHSLGFLESDNWWEWTGPSSRSFAQR